MYYREISFTISFSHCGALIQIDSNTPVTGGGGLCLGNKGENVAPSPTDGADDFHYSDLLYVLYVSLHSGDQLAAISFLLLPVDFVAATPAGTNRV